MKPTFITLLALCLCLGGCGKKEPVQPSASNPEAKKPVTVLWEFETGFPVTSSPAIGSDGTVYVGSFDKKLYAINGKTGVKLWEFETGDQVLSSPAIGSDGTVYVGSNDKKLYAIKTSSQGLAKSPWPMFGQNAQHTGRAIAEENGKQDVSGAQNPLGVLWLPGLVMLGVALLGLAASFIMPELKARNPDTKMRWDVFGSILDTLREMKDSGNPILIVASLWSMFYLIAYTIMLILPDYTVVLDISVSQVGLYLLGPLGISIGVGSALAGWISGTRIQPRFIPAGAIGLTICFFLLGWAPAKLSLVATYIALTGVCAGFYIVPLQALLQKLSPDESRGRFLGAAAAMSAFFEIVGIAVFHVARRVFDIPSQRVFLIVGVLALMATLLFYWKVRRHIHKPEWR